MSRILVIDDKPEVRLFLDRALTKAGHEVAAADSAKTAAEMIVKERYDLVIIDKLLPDRSGLDVLRMARMAAPKMPALVITGNPTAESRALAKSLGAKGYLVKPFDVSDLVSEVERALAPPAATAAH